MLHIYPDRYFKNLVRMNKDSFRYVVDLIQHHPVFMNNSKHHQHDVWIQSVVALQRLGCEGNGVSVARTALIFGISEGSVVLFTQRFIHAILSLEKEFVKWPNEHERKKISKHFYDSYGILGAVGAVDGTPVILSYRPRIDGEVFWNRKQRYALNIQLVCDHNKLIRSYVVGYPGSVADSVVWAQSDFMTNPSLYLSDGQWLLSDAGYALSAVQCTPYRQPEAELPHHKLFNFYFSAARVCIEHCNGIWKGRFSSLKGLKTQVKEINDFKRINEWIVSCIILHNILIQLKDSWENEEAEEDVEDNYNLVIQQNTTTVGDNLRQRVEMTCLNWHYSRR
jgi:hypothetical protein